MRSRLQVALACFPGLERALLDQAAREALDEVADLVHPEPAFDLGQEEARARLAGADVLLTGWYCPRLDAGTLDLAPRLRLVAHAAGTVKDFVTPEVFRRGIRVTSAAAANAIPVAEYTVAAILLANKRAFWANQHWHATGQPPDIGPRMGNRARSIGIVGASAVGRLVIAALHAHEVELAVYDPYLDTAGVKELGVELVTDLVELFRRSDLVSVHAPLLPETTAMIGAEHLAALPDGATIINTARGKIIDRSALEAALVEGRIFAVIDTSDPEPLPADSPLRGLANVFVTPHLAGSMGTEIARLGEYAVAEIARFARGEPLRYEVRAADLPRLA